MSENEFRLSNTVFWRILEKLIRIVMIVGNIGSTMLMGYCVIVRYVFKSNFYGSDEIIMIFAFWLYFMGAVYGSYENSHIKADLLSVYLKNLRIENFFELLAEACTIVVNTVVLVWAYRYFIAELTKGALSTALKIPLIIPKSAVFFGFLLMEFYHIYFFQSHLRTYIRKGIFTEPRPGDYISAAVKKRFPDLTLPVKGEADRAADGKEIQ